MTTNVSLSSSARDTTKTAKQLRHDGVVPCVVYGNVENTQIQCTEVSLKQAFMKAGESTLVDLEIEGKKVPVLFHMMDFDPVTDKFSHVDFYAVDMNKEVEASVALHFEGESLAVKELGGILVTPVTHVQVRCLPKNLPHNLTIDISVLAELHAVITVKDIKLPQGVEITNDADNVVATVQEPRKEEEVVVAAPAEGAAAAGAAPAAEGAVAADAKKEEKK